MSPWETSARSRPRCSPAENSLLPRCGVSCNFSPRASAALRGRAGRRWKSPMPAKHAITCGDPAGVGPEIIATWLAAHAGEAKAVAVIGPARWLATLGPAVGKIAAGLEDYAAIPGQPTGDGALVAWAAMERAAQGCKAGEFSGVVTGPVSKEWLARIGYAFPGQTEFFAARWGGGPVVGFWGRGGGVVLATGRVPFHQVSRCPAPHRPPPTIAAAQELAQADGVARPRIGVCG